ncbi:DEAD/DEAH box helicase [Desertibacillus haloalkaliphilus]|uniref:DEAD/DEAH box helicase n=1 Tax=Desertibacillus haloalkaliphilus TaxID=1328930 RepID=UPI001C280A0A|nr:DEAD/DEAH box helicase [Desertibacillus haloalkaliphilus]MBU8905357.1 DEAD/DEAH box helicase [Desertibacillus haloalkaliphilus]
MDKQFSDFQLAPFLTKALADMNITEPTDIQSQMIPELLDDQDVIARSQTGTGKTFAFLLPMLTKVDPTNNDLQALILAPTHELAMQIYDVVTSLIQGTEVKASAFIGSANIKRQLEKLKKQKPHVVVGTPGRIVELAEKKKLKLHQVKTLAVDEADRMLNEKPTWNDFEEIAKRVGRQAQFIFVSATITEDFSELVRQHALTPVYLESKGGLIEAEKVDHYYLTCEERERVDLVRRLIRTLEVERGIVFVNHLDKANEVTEKLRYKGIKADSLSGDSHKTERAKTIKDFQEGKLNIIVATDLAARGLDVDDITHIINLHLPVDADAYLHRAGRTGRIGKSGTVISIATPKEQFIIKKFEKALQFTITEKEYTRGALADKESTPRQKR